MQKGATLIEIIVTILIITMFSAILISDFPKILRQFALSRAAYNLEQNLRKTQDMGMSGVQIKNGNGKDITPLMGFGIYIDINTNPTGYLLYVDVNGNQIFDKSLNSPECVKYVINTDKGDCILETVDLANENPDLYIRGLINTSGMNYTSINFSPPSPTIRIDNRNLNFNEAGIILGLKSDDSASRTVWINAAGLIKVQ